MTIDAAEIARLRNEAGIESESWSPTILDLCDELEEARAERDEMMLSWTGPSATKALLAERDTNVMGWLAVDQQRIRDCTKLMDERDAALAAAYARDFPQPSKSDEERARLLLMGQGSLKEALAFAATIRAEATLAATAAERERCAKVADDFALSQRFYGMQAAHSIAAAIRKGSE